jgi:hypothetical protein
MDRPLCLICDRDPRDLPRRWLVEIAAGAYSEYVPPKSLPPEAPDWLRELLSLVPSRAVICSDCIIAGAVVLPLDEPIPAPEPTLSRELADVPEVVEALRSRRAARESVTTVRAAIAARREAQNAPRS